MIEVFDRQALLDRLMGDEELAAVIIAGFLDDMPRQLAAIKESAWQEKTDAAAAQAHKIKGAAANVGGDALCQVAFEMEKAGKAGAMEQLKDLLPQLESRFIQLKNAMESKRS